MSNPMMYVATMAVVTYLIRVLPLTLFNKPITNIYVQSFLYYVPYVTLAVMTFPTILYETNFFSISIVCELAPMSSCLSQVAR